MSESMLERIALALCIAAGQDPDIVAPEGEGELMWQTYLLLARAAIEAMRDNPDMQTVWDATCMRLADDPAWDGRLIQDALQEAWRDVFDAALSEGGADDAEEAGE